MNVSTRKQFLLCSSCLNEGHGMLSVISAPLSSPFHNAAKQITEMIIKIVGAILSHNTVPSLSYRPRCLDWAVIIIMIIIKNEQIQSQHAGSRVNPLLAASQRWGSCVANDDVTENTICQPLSHSLHSLFLVRLYFRNNKTHTRAKMHSPRGICSQTFIGVTHTQPTHESTDTQTHVCQQNMYHPVQPLTVLGVHGYSVCDDPSLIHHYTEIDRMLLI